LFWDGDVEQRLAAFLDVESKEDDLNRVNGQGEKMYLEDVPIRNPDQDRLERSSFARRLAESILSWRGEESIVIGVHGTWGSGKTSILNLTQYFLTEAAKGMGEEERPIILRFNPWNFAEQAQLMSMFFHQLAASLRMREGDERFTELAKRVARYGDFFEPAGTLLFGPVGGLIGRLVGKGVEVAGAGAKRRDEDFATFREEIDETLRRMSTRLVIIIDDLDRLNATEIKQMFQLVKLNADFPNTIYLLAFDPNVVQEALEESGFSGQAYLEKIVQVAFQMPPPETELLLRILFEQLDGVLSQVPETRWDERRWANLFHAGLKKFFNNVRDIKRFINALRLNYGLVAGEVNPIDFMGVEALRVFVPEAYVAMAQNKEFFVGTRRLLGRQQPVSQGLDNLLSRVVDESQRETVRALWGQLFPQMGVQYGPGTLREWRRQLRICAPDMFERYFLLGIPAGEISEVELETLLELTGHPGQLTSALRELIEQGRIRRFLERIEDYTDEVSVGDIEPLCLALLNIGDELPVEKGEFSDPGADFQLVRVLYQLLKRLPGSQDVCDLLVRVFPQSTSVFTPANVVSQLTYLSEKEEPNDLVLNSSQLQQLQELCVEKVQMARNQSSLQKAPHLNVVLFHWNEWGDPTDVRAYVADLIAVPEGLADFLAGFLSQIRSGTVGEYYVRREWMIKLDSVARYVEIEVLTERLASLRNQDLASFSERQLLAIDTFSKLTNEARES